MIKKTDIESLPTKLRNDIVEYLETSIRQAESIRRQSADEFVVTTDERHRSLALMAQGELNAFNALHRIFKKV